GQAVNRFKYKRGGGPSAYNAAHNVNQMHNYYFTVPENALHGVPSSGQYRMDDGPRFTQSQYEDICHMLARIRPIKCKNKAI
ncbi:hypothetical protein H5410_024154, partial [Solanum commersonii]